MRRRLSISIAVILITCSALAAWVLKRPPNLRASYDGWPIGMNAVVRDIAENLPCELTIEKEFTPGEPGGPSNGCMLVAQGGSTEDRDRAAPWAVDAIRRALEEKGGHVASTDSKSCKADYQIVYAGPTRKGMISIKELGGGGAARKGAHHLSGSGRAQCNGEAGRSRRRLKPADCLSQPWKPTPETWMSTPELKALDCLDHDPIEQWIPASDAEVDYRLCLHIGQPGSEACDLFYVQVTTPEAIHARHPGKLRGKPPIVVNPYSWESVLEAIQGTLARCSGADWNQQSALLAEHFDWEFDGYRP